MFPLHFPLHFPPPPHAFSCFLPLYHAVSISPSSIIYYNVCPSVFINLNQRKAQKLPFSAKNPSEFLRDWQKSYTFALAFEKRLPARQLRKRFFERFAIQTSSTREATFTLPDEGAMKVRVQERNRQSLLFVRDFDERVILLRPRIQTILAPYIIYRDVEKIFYYEEFDPGSG